jgi:hypothetical protein
MTLNAYSYVHGDPLNRVDSGGLCDVIIAGVTESPGQPETVGMNEFATATGAIQDYPYSGGSIPSGVADVLAPGLTGKAAPATVSAVIAILLAAQDPGPINIFTFSGGLQRCGSVLAIRCCGSHQQCHVHRSRGHRRVAGWQRSDHARSRKLLESGYSSGARLTDPAGHYGRRGRLSS